MIAVLDTNIVVRALINQHSPAGEIFDAFLDGNFTLATSESILQELKRTIQKPAVRKLIGLTDEEIASFLVLISNLSIYTAELYEVSVVVADPSDNKFLCCAIEAAAEYLVTDDREHLLPMKHFRLIDQTVRIISAIEFLKLLQQRERS